MQPVTLQKITPEEDPPYSQTLEILLRDLDLQHGLTKSEVEARLKKWGENKLPKTRMKPFWRIFASQFQSALIYILLVAAAIAIALGRYGDSGVILFVVLLNAAIGSFQERRAVFSMESLKKLSTTSVRVLRDGHTVCIPAWQLVPGDVVMLAAGDAVSADARLIETFSLEANESVLTGESFPAKKNINPLPVDCPLAERTNMVFAGCHISSGRGKAVVITTGLNTEIGRISKLTAGAPDTPTPLEARISKFGRRLAIAACLLFFIVVGLGMARSMPTGTILMVAISQMVSVVPEGLPVAMTVALALGMQRMASQGAVVRRLSAVETLGSTSVICTDKTGTLTKNEMTVTKLWLPGNRTIDVSGIGYSPSGSLSCDGREISVAQDAALLTLLEAVALSNDARVISHEDEGVPYWTAEGDPTEAALHTLALKGGVDCQTLKLEWPRHAEIPFDSSVGMMATQHGHCRKQNRIFIKGAPELVVPLCGHFRHGDERTLADESFKQEVSHSAELIGGQALRVLAIACLEGTIDENRGFPQFSKRADFLGLVGQMDPPREEVKDAIARCRAAGIRTVMVTGDHKATGISIARMLKIATEESLAIDGCELDALTDGELAESLDRIAVFARVRPEQKLRIIEAFRLRKLVVAMTGDGVNDAPALALADVGVAMGRTGTEVAKSAADIVVTDDNFATIVRAIEEGRLVYSNIQRLILFLFATSIDEVLLLLGALILGYPLPLAAVQILWINLVTEGVLGINLVMESGERNLMRSKPLSSLESLFTSGMAHRLVVMVGMSTTVTLGYYCWRLQSEAAFALVQSETFTLLALCQWFNVLNCKSSTQSSFHRDILKNKWLLSGLGIATLLQFSVIYLPFLNIWFHTEPIPLANLWLLIGLASMVLWSEEIRKAILANSTRQTTKS